ncbi:2-polyprenylphenol 6-hydroxylase [Afifella sp. JA880]|uniref:2-polyprenylphenol 6-hydroxylase n=1 Tax=Afifella sp. JA880 TaxID=2975280 RepID=UPI0021BA6CCE|nr:2-polyprenylphenol 6-hydroxylase [Afifella sp. JA880]MCT8268828.1 2-polyprenylphenol 6-hydroxylase [Afifella sp. JA880]
MLNLIRLTQAGFHIVRAGALGFVDVDEVPPVAARFVRFARLFEPRGLSDTERGRRLSARLHRLGPSYVKLGQFLATRPDIVGNDAAEALSGLKDEMPPFPTEEAKAIIEINLGRKVEEIFTSFSEPVAAASIAQVHHATRFVDGEEREVAVKVLRPHVRGGFQRDLETFYAGARFLERLSAEGKRLKPVAVVQSLERTVLLEMDLRLEAAAYSELSENIIGETEFRVPAVDWAHTGRDVLTMEWIDGIKLRNTAGIIEAGIDRQNLARIVVQSFLRHALRDGFFHADMHEGNLFVDREGRLVAVDLGIMGRIGPKERRFLAEVLYGFIKRDYLKIAKLHIEIGYVPPIHSAEDFAQALRAIGEPIHGQRASEISMARLLGLLFEVTALFNMQTRPELILLQKTMVVVEGVARRLDPDFDMWAAADPVVTEWISRHLGPVGRLEEAADSLREIGKFVEHLPDTLTRVESAVDRLAAFSAGGIKLDDQTVDRLADAGTKELFWTRWAVRLGGLALVVMAAASLWR